MGFKDLKEGIASLFGEFEDVEDFHAPGFGRFDDPLLRRKRLRHDPLTKHVHLSDVRRWHKRYLDKLRTDPARLTHYRAMKAKHKRDWYERRKDDPDFQERVKKQRHIRYLEEREKLRQARIDALAKETPEERTRRLAARLKYERKRLAEVAKDPERLAKRKAAIARQIAKRKARLESDPSYREREKAYAAKHAAKIKSDPELAAKAKEAQKRYRERLKAARRGTLTEEPKEKNG